MADKKDIDKLTDEEVDKLTDEELAEYGVTRADLEAAGKGGGDDDDDEPKGEPGSPERKAWYRRHNRGIKDENAELRRLLEEERRARIENAESLARDALRGKGGKDDEDTEEPEPAKPKGDLKALREKRRAALRAADTDKVADFDEQIENLQDEIETWHQERELWRERKTSKQIDTLVKRAGEEALTKAEQKSVMREMQATAEDIYEVYPFLDDGADDDVRDDDAIAAVRSRCIELQKKGMSPTRALKKAAGEKGPKFAKINGYDADGKKIDGDGDDGKGGDDDERDLSSAARIRRAIKRAAGDSQRQPANTARNGSGERTRTGQVKAAKDLTDDEIRKMDGEEIDKKYGKK